MEMFFFSLSRPGAMNLLKDFDAVSQWILSCNDIQKEHIEILAKHEVLRMCEGVGKILLRKPDEVISMISEIKFTKTMNGRKNFCFQHSLNESVMRMLSSLKQVRSS